MKRVSVDIGGTFTDCFVAWSGRYIEGKATFVQTILTRVSGAA